jgi:sporulation protein YtfJ
MSEHPIEGLMNAALQNIHEMMDVNTIIGEKIVTADGTVIIPVSKVTLGFASGGSDFTTKSNKDLFGGGGGAGGTIIPVAFLVVSGSDVKLLQISQNITSTDKAISLVPELFDKITGLFGKGKNKEKEKEKEPKQEEYKEAEAF